MLHVGRDVRAEVFRLSGEGAVMSMGWSLWIRWTYAMKEWRTQLLCCAEVLWHARPACSEAVWGWPGLGRWLAGMVVMGVFGRSAA